MELIRLFRDKFQGVSLKFELVVRLKKIKFCNLFTTNGQALMILKEKTRLSKRIASYQILTRSRLKTKTRTEYIAKIYHVDNV